MAYNRLLNMQVLNFIDNNKYIKILIDWSKLGLKFSNKEKMFICGKVATSFNSGNKKIYDKTCKNAINCANHIKVLKY